MSELRTYVIDTGTRFTQKRLYWMNPFGVIDGYTYTGALQRNYKVSRSQYRKTLPISFGVTDRGRQLLGTDVDNLFELTSNYETYTALQWLSEVLFSPGVWIYENSQYVPLVCLTDEYTYYDSQSTLMTFSAQFGYANPIETLRG